MEKDWERREVGRLTEQQTEEGSLVHDHSLSYSNDAPGFLGYAFVMLNDLHVYDTANFSWKDLSKSVTGNAPSARSGHGFTSALGQLYVQGGWNKIGEQDKCTPIADLEVESKFQILRSLSLHLNSASLV